MLTKITNLPSHVLGIRASGKVTREDIDKVLLPALDELSHHTGQLSYLLVLDTKVQNFTTGAWWKDLVAGIKHYTLRTKAMTLLLYCLIPSKIISGIKLLPMPTLISIKLP